MTKAEALAQVEEAKANLVSLESFIAACDQKEVARPIAERFTTSGGRTGVILSLPEDVSPAEARMPITEYLVRKFIAMGGKVYDAEARITLWNTARFPLAAPLWSQWKGSAEKTYKTLDDQPLTRDLAGQTFVFLVDTAQEIETNVGRSFEELVNDKVDFANPVAWLSLFLSLPDPTDVTTYPSYASWNWEWIGALVKTDFGIQAASAYSDGVGARLDWDAPGFRARAAALAPRCVAHLGSQARIWAAGATDL